MGGPGGMGGPGRGAHGIPACAATKNCIPYQFTWTRVSKHPVLTSSTPVSVTTTGVIAGDNYGSTYYEVTVSPFGPWASKATPQEFIYVRDLDTLLGYIQNVTKNTYRKFTIRTHTPPSGTTPNPDWKGPGKGPGKGPRSGGPTITKTSVNGTSYGGYTCLVGEMTTITGADFTSHRVYCSDLRIVVEEDTSSPQFASTYTLTGYTSKLSGTLPFSPSGTLEPDKKFDDHRGHRPGDHKPESSTP